MPPEDELPGPPVSEEAAGGQSLLLADVLLPVELPLALPLLGEADWLPGGQSDAALDPAALLGELLSDEPVLGALLLGELVSDGLVLGALLSDELVLGEPEYEPLDDCAIAPAEKASSAPAVAAAIDLSFIVGTPFRNVRWKCAVGSARS